MIHRTIGGRRLVVATAVLALLAGGTSGFARAQDQGQEEGEKQAQERRHVEREMAARKAQMEKEMAARHEQLARGMARRAGGLARLRGALARAPRAPQAPQLRVRAPMRFRTGGGAGVDRILDHAEELGLSDPQAEQIRSAHTAHRRAEIERDAAIEVAELDLEELMDAGESADLVAVEAKMMEIAQLRVESRIAEMRTRRQIQSVLTAEQREQLEEMGPRGLFRFRTGDGEGRGMYFMRERDGEQGWTDDEGYSFFFKDGGWSPEFEFRDDALFESLAPLHEFDFWFGEPHEDGELHERHDDPDGDTDGTSGVATKKATGVKTQPAA